MIRLWFVILFLIVGCAELNPVIYNTGEFSQAPAPSFWTQKVRMTGWGLSWVTQYGPMTFGYLNWERNVDEQTNPAALLQALQILLKAGYPISTVP